jgi:EAL domain-containing protein (putative c-di-GMP-specific phosphodiesterase class I)
MAELKSLVVRAGDIIFRDGDKADFAYLVQEGIVQILGGPPHHTIIAEIPPGGLLGEMGILDSTERSATAMAKTDAKLTVIDRAQLKSRLASADPVLALLVNVFINRMRHQLHPDKEIPAITQSDYIGLNSLKLETELQAAMGAGDMRLYLQPIAHINDLSIAGFEALVRWEHPEKGIIRPDIFIKAAEDSGLIIPLGRWIVREACRLSQAFEFNPNKAGVYQKSAFISINVSARQFKDVRFFEFLELALNESEIDPHRVKLEITESALSDIVLAKSWIKQAKSLGVRIALDDFGTGYSSLSYLHEFDFDTLKIDQSFIRGILNEGRSRHIVEVIMILAKKISLEVIAEGVESLDQVEALKKIGCELVQGYAISKPQPATSFY